MQKIKNGYKSWGIVSLLVFVNIIVTGQNLTLNFKSKYPEQKIDSVVVTNYRTNQKVTIPTNESITLTKITGIKEQPMIDVIGEIYPNPNQGKATLSFHVTSAGEVIIKLYNISGQLLHVHKDYLETGYHSFNVHFPYTGIYNVFIVQKVNTFSLHAITSGMISQPCRTDYLGMKTSLSLKSYILERSMSYKDQDMLQFMAYSGKNSTVLTDIPNISKTYTFEFYECQDPDEQSYPVVRIGDQVWMAKNLAYLPKVDGPAYASRTVPHFYVYDYMGTNKEEAKKTVSYYRLGVQYNWPAAMNGETHSSKIPSGVKGICPNGWHLPSNGEWLLLLDYLSKNGYSDDGVEDGNMLASALASPYYWWAYAKPGAPGNNSYLNNKSGFSALPGGLKYPYLNSAYYGDQAFFWTTSWDYMGPMVRNIAYTDPFVHLFQYNEDYSFSVRCVREPYEQSPAPDFKTLFTTVTVGKEIQFEDLSKFKPDTWLWNFGDGNLSSEKNPTHTYLNTGTYTVTLTVTNSFGENTKVSNGYITVINNELGTLTDSRDGKIYPTVLIGNQWWMAENLAYLPSVNPGTLSLYNKPAYYVYGFEGTDIEEAKSHPNFKTFGVLYNHNAALNGSPYSYNSQGEVRGACPEGWHIPGDSEWNNLISYLISNGYNYDGTKTGNKIAKALAGKSEWFKSDSVGTPGYAIELNNTSGFGALPGGMRIGGATNFDQKSFLGFWWSAPSPDYNIPSLIETKSWDSSFKFSGFLYDTYAGYSIRCIKDISENIPPRDPVLMHPLNNQDSVSITPYLNWECSDPDGDSLTYFVYVDQNYPPVSFISEQASSNLQMQALFHETTYYWKVVAKDPSGRSTSSPVWSFTTKPAPLTGTFTDTRDNRIYKWIKIGNQTWMAENLGWMPSVSNSDKLSDNVAHYYVYNYFGNDLQAAKKSIDYLENGTLYNWTAAMNGITPQLPITTVKGACPDGWHLPWDYEWETLIIHLTKEGYNFDGSNGTDKLAKAMADSDGWFYSIKNGSPGNNLGANNSSGFSGKPSGYISNQGSFENKNALTYWWSANEFSSSNAIARFLYYDYNNTGRYYLNKSSGFNVRCIKDE